MHPQSLDLMAKFAATVPDGALVLDVGSRDVNGNYAPLFAHTQYTGFDILPGHNVHILGSDPYDWPLATCCYDYVISGQCVEHVREPWKWIQELARVLKVGGRCCLIAPWAWPKHDFPIDCWRVLPDGMAALLGYAGLKVMETSMYGEYGRSDCDCVGVGEK